MSFHRDAQAVGPAIRPGRPIRIATVDTVPNKFRSRYSAGTFVRVDLAMFRLCTGSDFSSPGTIGSD
jgi:hypothetical protein